MTSTSVTDYDGLLQANLMRVFNEHDPERRMTALRELYAEDAVLYEPQASVRGHAAISAAVSSLLATLPRVFSFIAEGPAVGHHGIGRLKWHAGPAGGPVAVTGVDVAHIEENRIHALYVFLDS
jgi:hypothetical protein